MLELLKHPEIPGVFEVIVNKGLTSWHSMAPEENLPAAASRKGRRQPEMNVLRAKAE
jgi:hypothetical protein